MEYFSDSTLSTRTWNDSPGHWNCLVSAHVNKPFEINLPPSVQPPKKQQRSHWLGAILDDLARKGYIHIRSRFLYSIVNNWRIGAGFRVIFQILCLLFIWSQCDNEAYEGSIHAQQQHTCKIRNFGRVPDPLPTGVKARVLAHERALVMEATYDPRTGIWSDRPAAWKSTYLYNFISRGKLTGSLITW